MDPERSESLYGFGPVAPLGRQSARASLESVMKTLYVALSLSCTAWVFLTACGGEDSADPSSPGGGTVATTGGTDGSGGGATGGGDPSGGSDGSGGAMGG